jgi:hypothetical protein
MGMVVVACCAARVAGSPAQKMTSTLALTKLGRYFRKLLGARLPAPPCDDEVLALDGAGPAQFVEHRDVMRRCSRLDGQTAKAISPPRLLRADPARPRNRSSRRAAEQCYELPSFHSITSSARAMLRGHSTGGMRVCVQKIRFCNMMKTAEDRP